MTRRSLFARALWATVGGVSPPSCRSVWGATGVILPPVVASDREVTCLLPDAAGVWVGTSGGLVRIDKAGYRRFTRADGLPAHEVRFLAAVPGGVQAILAKSAAQWDGSRWTEAMVSAPAIPPPPPLPPGATGTHVSAYTTSDTGDTIVATWDDARLFRRAPGASTWQAEASGLPSDVGNQITAVAEQGKTLWVGTRRAGLWRRDGTRWQSLTPSGATPRSHNAQALCRFGGRFWASTLDDGLMVFGGSRWEALAPPVLSSDAPRQLVAFQNRLFVRHGSGAIDCWNGSGWIRNVFGKLLPRRQASALAVGGGKLIVGVWGGFSVWDGMRWAHHTAPKLAGVPIGCVAASPDGKTIWLGTQGRGLCEADAQTGGVRRFHDERDGLPDDWVTEIAQDTAGRLYAGTFVGGLAVRAPGSSGFITVPATAGENITGIVPHRAGAWAATRHGVRAYYIDPLAPAMPARLSSLVTGSDVEAQCLLSDGDKLVVGTRTGIYTVPQPAA